MEQEHKIDIKQALRVFDKATRKGEKREDGWHFRGITATTDFDGYTVMINTPKVQLTIFFHNKYTVDYARAHDLQEFIEVLEKLDRA